MHQLNRPSLAYSSDRKPFHDGMNEEHATFTYSCPHCGHTVLQHALQSISSGTAWFRSLQHHERQRIASVFGLVLRIEGPRELPYIYLPNSRIADVCLSRCSACDANSVTVLEFYERQPARYIGVLQGVALLKPEDQHNGAT